MHRISILLFLTALLFTACSKEPGEGGSASISGKVFGYDINTAGIVTDSAYAGDYRVLISYGNNKASDNDIRTSYTGDYSFTGLRKGNYRVYVYSQCDTCTFNQSYSVQEVEITSNKQELTLPDFVIYD